MGLYFKVVSGEIVERRPEPLGDGLWLPAIVEGRKPYDETTHTERVDIIIEPERVRQVFRVVEREIETVRAELSARLAEDAERARGVVLTLAAGKSMSYAEKAAEARLILDDESNPPPADAVPILSREATARGLSLLDMARLVMSRYLACKDAEAAINEIEVRGGLAIGAASTAAQARAAYEAVTWPLTR
jgi:hypothetical protein